MSGGSKAALRKKIHRVWGMRHRPDNEPDWRGLMEVAGFCPDCGHNGHRRPCQGPVATDEGFEPCECETVRPA